MIKKKENPTPEPVLDENTNWPRITLAMAIALAIQLSHLYQETTNNGVNKLTIFWIISILAFLILISFGIFYSLKGYKGFGSTLFWYISFFVCCSIIGFSYVIAVRDDTRIEGIIAYAVWLSVSVKGFCKFIRRVKEGCRPILMLKEKIYIMLWIIFTILLQIVIGLIMF